MMKRIAPITAALVALLSSALALAQTTSEEPPLEPNMAAVWIFFGVVALLIVWGIWLIRRNSKKRPEEVEGEKF